MEKLIDMLSVFERKWAKQIHSNQIISEVLTQSDFYASYLQLMCQAV